MAALTAAQRAEVVADFHRVVSGDGQSVALTKAQVAAFIDDVDAWRAANEVAYNQGINATARASLSAKLKALGLMMVVQKYYGVTP